MAGVHNLLPFLLIGIGVDDMFVISAAVDQTDTKKTAEERLTDGLKHAGPSITITSFTNIIAFWMGATTSLEALSSFCLFAGVGVLMLYLSSLSIYSSFLYWDVKRQLKQKGDCCGACCCKETTFLCCFGKCLTDKQKRYPFRGEKPEIEEIGQEEYASGTQRFFYETFSRYLLSTYGKLTVLAVWIIYILISLYGLTGVTVEFKTTYFIKQDHFINDYFTKMDTYFK